MPRGIYDRSKAAPWGSKKNRKVAKCVGRKVARRATRDMTATEVAATPPPPIAPQPQIFISDSGIDITINDVHLHFDR